MNSAPKIHLSTLERELIQNKEWILTKRDIIKKVYQLFGEMHNTYKEIFTDAKFSIPGFLTNTSAKISRGENYLGLPYVIMDYPASFSKQNIFAVRTMFWWGNFFSVSLHLSGKFFQPNSDFDTSLIYLKQNNFFVCINENQWQHSFDPSNYCIMKTLDNEKTYEILKKHFFKISKKIELSEWENVPTFLETTFTEIIKFVQINFPNDERDLLLAFPKGGSDL